VGKGSVGIAKKKSSVLPGIIIGGELGRRTIIGLLEGG